MALSYYFDVHVPASITEGLRRRGIDVLTSQQDGTREAGDEELLQRATDLGRLLFSQDEDLLEIAAERQHQGVFFAGLIFAPQGTSIGHCTEDLELIAHCLAPDEAANRMIFVPLR